MHIFIYSFWVFPVLITTDHILNILLKVSEIPPEYLARSGIPGFLGKIYIFICDK